MSSTNKSHCGFFNISPPVVLALLLTACSSETHIERLIETEVANLVADDMVSGCAAAGTTNEHISLLLVGNSLMNDIEPMLEELLACSGHTSDIATSNPGGYRLEQHLTNDRTINLIASGYDLTLLQAHSDGIKNHLEPFEVLNELKRRIEASGSTMGFYQTWGFQDRDTEITENILSRYELIAGLFDAPLIHIGRAWDFFYTSNNETPPFSLFLDYAHATDQGKHLIAYTLYAYLTGQSPIRLNNLKLNEDEAFQLQTIAWATYKANTDIQSIEP